MVSIVDVASRANVSIKTVSRVLNGESNVRPSTMTRVQKAIDELSYSPSPSARGMRSKRSFCISLLSQGGRSDYFSDIQFGAIETCRRNGYQLIVSHINDYASLSKEQLRQEVEAMIKSPKPDAMILPLPFADDAEIISTLEEHDIPSVLISPYHPTRRSLYVAFNERMSAYDLTQHLIELGHTSIGLIRGVPGYGSTELRTIGFKEAMRASGLQVDDTLVRDGLFRFQEAFDITNEWLALSEPPTAIFAMNDEMALGACNAAIRKGLRIPDDLSIAGFDDSSMASMVVPRLTTVRQPAKELAVAATEMALEAARKRPQEPVGVNMLPYDLIVRGSTTKRHSS